MSEEKEPYSPTTAKVVSGEFITEEEFKREFAPLGIDNYKCQVKDCTYYKALKRYGGRVTICGRCSEAVANEN